MSLKEAKTELRKAMMLERDSLEPEVKAKMDEALTSKIIAFIKERSIKVVHSYISMGSEINLLPLLQFLLQEGITVVTPRSLPKRKLENLVLRSLNELEEGIYGTQHPSGNNVYDGAYDLIIVPGLAFDVQGFRLGYGAGYYDIFLAEQKDAIKVGLCYPFQMVEKVPVEEHDVRVDVVMDCRFDRLSDR